MPSFSADTLDDADLSGETQRLYEALGARPVINAAGAFTLLGGSALSQPVRAAMDAANYRYADMQSLLESSGRVIAEMLGAEAAYVTAGAAAALALSVGACLTRDHRDYIERLPDTRGIPDEVLVQKNSRQKYDRCLTVPGARIVEAGDASGLTPEQLDAAIGPDTIAVHWLAPGTAPGTPSIEAVIEVAHRHGVPVIVDAAGQTYPVDNLRRYARLGADLVCYAGKYFDAPQSTGLIVGRGDLVELAAINGFVGFEISGYHGFGRPMKVDRQEIFGCVVALREWLAMDHESRLQRYGERIDVLLAMLRGRPGVESYRISQRETPHPTIRDGVRIVLDSAERAERVVEALKQGERCIWTRNDGNAINLSVAYLHDGDIEVVAQRLREVL